VRVDSRTISLAHSFSAMSGHLQGGGGYGLSKMVEQNAYTSKHHVEGDPNAGHFMQTSFVYNPHIEQKHHKHCLSSAAIRLKNTCSFL